MRRVAAHSLALMPLIVSRRGASLWALRDSVTRLSVLWSAPCIRDGIDVFCGAMGRRSHEVDCSIVHALIPRCMWRSVVWGARVLGGIVLFGCTCALGGTFFFVSVLTNSVLLDGYIHCRACVAGPTLRGQLTLSFLCALVAASTAWPAS